MIRIIYNHAEKSGREQNSKTKGCLNYNKETKTFSCESSDLKCMNAKIKNLTEGFEITVEESGNAKTFSLKDVKWDSEGELQYEIYESEDGKHRFIIWND
jgi:hypothetical protein